MTIRDHLRMIGAVYGLLSSELRRRTVELLRFFNLWPERETYLKEASDGMRKKLALALALLHIPKILFLDEALSGIDPVTGSRIRTLLKKLALRGMTIFITSHTLEVVEPLIDEYAIINRGQLVHKGTRAELTAGGNLWRRYLCRL